MIYNTCKRHSKNILQILVILNLIIRRKNATLHQYTMDSIHSLQPAKREHESLYKHKERKKEKQAKGFIPVFTPSEIALGTAIISYLGGRKCACKGNVICPQPAEALIEEYIPAEVTEGRQTAPSCRVGPVLSAP